MIILFDEKQDCCGCTACKSICPNQAIVMKPDKKGFLYPGIYESRCVECGLCKEVCSFQIGYDTIGKLESPIVYALKHKSDKVRMSSSSGGAFSAISDCILSKNGVIYGAAYDDKLHVIHKRAETREKRNEFRGSKYVQSDLKDVFLQTRVDLKNGRLVLFTGTPCQISGLNSYLKRTYTRTDQLITLDIICHGVPSPLIFADFLDYCQKKSKIKIMDFNFRSKVNGWGHTEEIHYVNGRKDHTSALSQTYKELYNSLMSLRIACNNCKYTNFNRPSDITIADFWGAEDYFPDFADELGISAIILNTDKGKSLYTHFKLETDTLESKIEDCAAKQRNMYKPTARSLRKSEFWKDYSQRGFDYVIRKYTGYGLKKEVKFRLRNRLDKMGLMAFIQKVRIKQ